MNRRRNEFIEGNRKSALITETENEIWDFNTKTTNGVTFYSHVLDLKDRERYVTFIPFFIEKKRDKKTKEEVSSKLEVNEVCV